MKGINRYRYLFALLVYLFPLFINIDAQNTTYPVQVYTQLVPPYTPYAPAYYSGAQDKLKVTIINSDMQQPSLQIYLRMQITSSTFSMINPPEVYTPSFELQAGVPFILSLNDLEPYFKKENLRISGGQSQFYRTQMLPDNFYRFHFEVFEANTNRLLSNSRIGFAQAMIAAGDPPILNLPLKGSVVTESNIPNIMFTWTPRHMSSVAAAYGTEYEVSLVEIQDKQANPENAFQYSRVLYTETSRSTSFIHTAAQPLLIPGMRYAWRVRAVAREGIDEANVFRNNGFSEIFWFDYKGNCPVVVSSGVVTQRTEANISWVQTEAIDYIIEYRKKGSTRWYNGTVSGSSGKIYSLKPGETYEYRIGSRCYANDIYDYSEIKGFTMPAELERSPNCGIMPDVNLQNQTPARELQSGMPVLVGDFPVFITKVSGSGRFSGEGYVGIPYIDGTQVAVTFKDIVVNTDNRMISGFFETKYDPNNNNMLLDLDEVLTGGKGVGDIRSGEEKAAFQVDYAINPNMKAKPVKKDGMADDIADGSDYTFTKGENGRYEFIIEDEKGEKHKIESETMPVTIEDSTGSTYEVNEKGDVTKISSSSEVKLDNKTMNKLNPKIAAIDFRESGNSRYALDGYKGIYEKVTEYNDQYRIGDDNAYASAKFMLPGTTDEIEAFIKSEGKESDKLVPSKVRFVTDKGKEYEARYNEATRTWTITITGGAVNDGQQLYAVQEIGTGQYLTLGKLNIFTYEPIRRSVTLVPVNGEMNSLDRQTVERELNRIYGKIGIEWTVNVLDVPFSYTPVNGSTFNVTGSGLFSTETNDMKAINEAFTQSGQYQEDGLYLFILPFQASDKGEVADTGGDMPLGKQFGYLFPGAGVRTIAHELGHGAFRLEHPFSRALRNSFEMKALPDNLMDYTQGTEFAKIQWDQTRAPGMVIGLFQKDKDAMSDRVKDISKFLSWIKDNIGKRNINYNKYQFYDSHAWVDIPIKSEDLDAIVYIELEDSGELDLALSQDGYAGMGIDFKLKKGVTSKYYGFYFKIYYTGTKKEAITIWFYSYEEFEKFFKYLGLSIKDKAKENITNSYKEAIKSAGTNCNELDVIYETIPDFVAKELDNETLYSALESLADCSMKEHSIVRHFAIFGDNDEKKAVLNILKAFDSAWFYNKVNRSPVLLEKLLINKIGANSSHTTDIVATLVQLASSQWNENDLTEGEFTILGNKEVDINNSIVYQAGLERQVMMSMNDKIWVGGCWNRNTGEYEFGNQIVLENGPIVGGSIFGCNLNSKKKAMEPILVMTTDEQEMIIPAVVAKLFMEDERDQGIKDLINFHAGLLLPEVLIKPATLAKWSKFLKGKGGKITEVADDVVKEFKNSLAYRLRNESQMTLRYSESELKKIITAGKELDIPKGEIEDIIFNGCRDSKLFTTDELITQLKTWNDVRKNGYPVLFSSLDEYEQFGDIIKAMAKEWDLPANSIYIQGSSLRIKNVSEIGDIDIAIKVDAATFELLVERFRNATTNVGRKETILTDAAKGRISGGNMYKDSNKTLIREIRDNLDKPFGDRSGMTKISIIKEGSNIDVSPYLLLK